MAAHLPLKRNLCIAYCGVIWFLYGPISIYGIITFYQSRYNFIFTKRQSHVTIYLLLCALSLLMVFVPLIMLAYCNSTIFIDIDLLKWHNYGIYTIYPTIILLLQTLYIFIWRQFLYYLDAKFMKKAETNRRWREFIRNGKWHLIRSTRKRLAQNSFMFYKMMSLLFILTTISLCIWPIYLQPHEITSITELTSSIGATVIWLMASLILLIIIECKTPKFTDAFFMRKEKKYWLYIALITALIIIANVALDLFVFDSSKFHVNSSKFHVIITMTNYFLISSALFVAICVSTIWLMSNINLRAEYEEMDKVQVALPKAEKVRTVSSEEASVEKNFAYDTLLLDVLQDEHLFNQFMQHLTSEFSIEIMLALIELTQFQRYIFEFAQTIDAIEMDENFVPVDSAWRIKFSFFLYPASIPDSYIVHEALRKDETALCQHLAAVNMNAEDEKSDAEVIYLNVNKTKRRNKRQHQRDSRQEKVELMMKAHKLYSKYIQQGAELQIYLPREDKREFRDKMDHFNAWVNLKDENGKQLNMVFNLFEKPMHQMYLLMNCAFARFKSSVN